MIEKYEIHAVFRSRRYCSTALYKGRACIRWHKFSAKSRSFDQDRIERENRSVHISEYRISTVCNPHASSFILQNVAAGGPQRQANGEAAHNHNGYPAPASSSAHNVLNPMNNLNGINAQASYDAK